MIPVDWNVEILEHLSAFITKGSTPTTYGHKWQQSGILFLRSECVSEKGLDFTQSMHISLEAHLLLRRSEVKDEDILITITGNVGRVAFLKGIGRANINQHIARLRIIEEEINPYFIYHFLSQSAIRKYYNSIVTGQAYPQISLKQVRETPIRLPPTKAEQTAIANALSDADALIQSLTHLITKKRQIKQGAMQNLLNPYENGRLKAGWVVKKLGDVANICRGASPRPIDSPKWFDENSDIGWVRISDITRAKKYLKTTVQKLTAEGVKHSRYVSSNNLIMSICATVGRPILNQIDVCIHDGFVVFGNCTVDKQYLYYFLDSVEQDWSKHGQTGSQMNLNTRLINDTVFPIPKVFSEQTRIATILSDMDTEIAALEAKLAKYRHIKQGMMQNLLTGRIRLVKPESNNGAIA